MQACLATKQDALAIAKIHKKEIIKSFLSALGLSFLRKFYEAVICHKGSFCIVVKDNSEIIGFAAGTSDIKSFNRYFFKNYALVLILIILPKIFNPFVIKRIFEDFFYLKKTKNLPKAELLAIAVKKEFQNKGLGAYLLQNFISEIKNRRVNSFKVLVGKDLGLSDFYRKNGFQLLGEINLHSKKPSLIFIYKIN